MPSLSDIVRSESRAGLIVLAAFALALMLGGGGIFWPLTELSTELVLASGALAWVFAARRGKSDVFPPLAWVLAALVVLLPAAQLVPLSPGIWQALPGRGLEQDALDVIGRAQSWRPFSMTPERTLSSLLGMAAAAALIPMVASLRATGRTQVLGVVVLVGLASLLVGVAQVTGMADGAFVWVRTSGGILTGFEANRNSQADLLLIAMVWAAGLASDLAERFTRKKQSAWPVWMAFVTTMVFGLGIVLTQSRTGIVLVPLALLAQAIILRRWLRPTWRHVWVLLAVLVLGGAGLAFGLRDNARIDQVEARFARSGELRPEIWRDTRAAIDVYAPAGSGMGSFIPIFNSAERLEMVDNTFTNRAHNDYLEFYLEAGLPGVAIVAIILIVLVFGTFRAIVAAQTGIRAQHVCAMFALAEIALHSFVDYPLRSIALACIAAASAGLLLARHNSVSPFDKVKEQV